jgi:hypothetical protein
VLYGVDIEPRAIELCRLRYWLWLLVDLPLSIEPHPLPNLEYRTVVANSLVDFASGVEIQNTRGGLSFFHNPQLVRLHDQWFAATGDEKTRLRVLIDRAEEDEIEALFQRARDSASARHRHGPEAVAAELAHIDEIATRFRSRDREFPCFAPALHAPEIAERGGWDIVIMNPPYVSRKEVPRRLTAAEVADLKDHFGDTNDLMILFAERALQYTRRGGAVSMIFNDSITTSVDANELRRRWASSTTIRTMARTKCFEGRAINGGVVVLRDRPPDNGTTVTWVEGYRRNVRDFADASDPRNLRDAHRSKPSRAGELEVWRTPLDDLLVLPHQPQFRPSLPALRLLDDYRKVRDWSTPEGWSTWDPKSHLGWTLLFNTRGLERHIAELSRSRWFERLQPGDWILFGLVLEGGQGLATADDRRFLAVIDGTGESDEVRVRQAQFEQLVLDHPQASATYKALRDTEGREAALLAAWDGYGASLRWPRSGLIRLADPQRRPSHPGERRRARARHHRGTILRALREGRLERRGRPRPDRWRWVRDNPIVIDWSEPSVELLRSRVGGGARSPRIQ